MRTAFGPATGFLAGLMLAVGLTASSVAPALAQGASVGPVTNLPLPRFVSIADSEANVRVAPGADRPLAWKFVRRGWPVEVIQEFDTWRMIRDVDGQEGWVLFNLLSGQRTAVVTPGETGPALPIRAEPSVGARVTAYLEPGVLGLVDRCRDGWCRLTDSQARFNGWIEQDLLWGVYPDEEF